MVIKVVFRSARIGIVQLSEVNTNPWKRTLD